MGGLAALTAQAEYGLGRALVLVDITPKAEPAGIERIQRFMESGLGGFDTLADAVEAVVAYNPARTRPPREEGLRKNLRQRGGRWYWHWDPRLLGHHENGPDVAAAREIRARRAAESITVPTLLIRGAQSDVVSDDGVHDLLARIPGSRHIDVSGAGHMVSGDDNDVLSQGLVEFLDAEVEPAR
jgi:pimeloyl-ACP methyl ester carboxylesterase